MELAKKLLREVSLATVVMMQLMLRTKKDSGRKWQDLLVGVAGVTVTNFVTIGTRYKTLLYIL